MNAPDAANSSPTLHTTRLTLQVHTLSDFEDCAAMWGDPEVMRYLHNRPFTREESWARLLRYVGHWQLLGFGFWAVREEASGRFVGEVGLADFRRNIRPSIDGFPEIGWVLAPWAHGKGFATEAARTALSWADRRFGSVRTVCIIHPENSASLRVAFKCGYGEFGRTTYKDSPVILLERIAERPSGRLGARSDES
jgi:RimJ/RimL family protein N-acetyltransferase